LLTVNPSTEGSQKAADHPISNPKTGQNLDYFRAATIRPELKSASELNDNIRQDLSWIFVNIGQDRRSYFVIVVP